MTERVRLPPACQSRSYQVPEADLPVTFRQVPC
jgi:hypothetical protein